MRLKSCLFNSCCGLSILLAVTLIVVQIFFLEGIIRSQAEQGIVMTDETHSLWGVIPGDTNTFTMRNFSMFDFVNSKEFLYQKNVTPVFVQNNNYLYQELSEFVNHHYTENDSIVNFDYWLYFHLLEGSRNIQQKLNVINVGPMGFWMQLDSTQITSFTLQGFGGLFVQMNRTIKSQAIGQGVASTFLSTFQVLNGLCGNLGISRDFCWYLWNDRYFGIDNDVNMQFWVQAAYYKDQQTKQCLYEYFYPITIPQFQGLLFEISELCEAVEHILNNWYCPNSDCSSYALTIKQISSAGVTNNPPPGSDPQQSICSTNSTCIGSPQITTFLHKQFKKQFPDEKYQILSFSQQTFSALFTPYKGLLNIGTLNKIYQLGSQYDTSKQQKLLQELVPILHTQTKQHAFVIWQWIKYMTNQFVLKQQRGGSRKIAGLGGVFSQALYQVTYAFADWFLGDVYSFLAFKQIGGKCVSTLEFLGKQKAEKICSELIPDEKDYVNFGNIIEPCLNWTYLQIFKQKYQLTGIQMQQYCDNDEEPSNIGLTTLQIMQKVYQTYKCTQNLPTKKCTQIDIIIKQLFNSTITLNPLDIQGYPYRNMRAISAHQWNDQIPTFQYKQFLKVSKIEDPQEHLQYEIQDLFTFDKFLNGQDVQQLFMIKNDTEFYHKYHWVNPDYLRNYIRFIVIQVGFGGFTQKRSVKQMMFGYIDPFLDDLSKSDTMAGGDPSIIPFIAFNQLNMTKQQSKINKQSMYSGLGQNNETRQYHSIFQKQIIVFNFTSFDGENVHWDLLTPWAENVPLQGTDGFSVPPNLQQNQNPTVYISSIARFAVVEFKQNLQMHGFSMRDMRIQKKALQSYHQNQENRKYYQGISGFLNSSYQGFPLFVSKTHFFETDQKWGKRVKILDLWGNTLLSNEWDDTRIIVEPYTGTAFSATINLQSNFYFQPDDILFPSFQQKNNTQNYRMLPIVNTFRSGNISKQAIQTLFGDLRDIIDNKTKVASAGWVILGICFAVILSLKVREHIKKQKNPREGEKGSLLDSDNAVAIQQVQV